MFKALISLPHAKGKHTTLQPNSQFLHRKTVSLYSPAAIYQGGPFFCFFLAFLDFFGHVLKK
jgi:hypothetical protein